MRCVGCQQRSHMESRRRNPLRRYPTAVCISVLHFGLTHSKTRALNSPVSTAQTVSVIAHSGLSGSCSGMFAASTKRRTSSTEARLAFAVLTRERNAA